ncbi:adenylate/guanylate cyclase domain-containing protein [Lutimaribacter marinistellae]|uniref:Adenylate/guanylate cyclase domain-containing protein n=1 Tax=Lutimaribacter marinistellae TaxID=1820329 RepID=A0ABV7TI87_9RHOB
MVDGIEHGRGAILALDVVGFSALMGADETGTLKAVGRLFDELVLPAITKNGGRVFKTMGDGALAEFANGADAARCGLYIQSVVVERNDEFHLRIGINHGALFYLDGDVYGDTVNVAARLEGMAAPNGVLISDAVHTRLLPEDAAVFFDNGARKFKNIASKIRVWSWPERLPSPRSAGKPRVFVEEFSSRGGPDEDAGDLFSQEVKRHLARLSGLETTANSENAHYLIGGNLRFASNKCRVAAQLKELENDREIWTERFDTATDDIFKISDKLAPGVVMNVRRRVASHDAERLRDRPLDELSKDDLMALAGASFFNPTYEGWNGAGIISEQVLELDPNAFMALAMAAAGLGLAEPLYTLQATPEPVLNLAMERIETALRLNNRSDMLHSVRAGLLLYGRRQYAEAEAAARQALAVNEEYNMGWWMLGAIQVFSGNPAEGAISAKHAVDLEPGDPFVHLYCRIAGYGCLATDRYEEAAEWFRRADQLAPGLLPNLIALVACHAIMGDQNAAATALKSVLNTDREFRMEAANPLPFQSEDDWMKICRAVETAAVSR